MSLTIHAKDDLNMGNHQMASPMTTYFDYKKIIFPIHRVLASFFDPNIIEFSFDYFLIARKFILDSTETTETKNKIIDIMEKLTSFKNFPVIV